ncbi:related to Long-chain-fatty-acid--CoA ligase [Pseudozyma flocculosa]|uniref:Related to Long-chain-fatty-acid--CoA ligase n=1 Tax=Pseudozyma flocculosa TaxID=84751 RepID=A0A5C3FDZ5_9BASI|nr:related to Long-chain-fatty-acid--CoA ligase [Pseudozyma flocculosa]
MDLSHILGAARRTPRHVFRSSGSAALLPIARRSLSHTYRQHPTLRADPSDPSSPLLSRVSGPTDKPLSELTLGQFWKETVASHGDRQALVSLHEPATQHAVGSLSSSKTGDGCIRWSYADMDEHIKRLVAGLRRLGVKKGQRVAVLMMNSSAYGALQWATAEIGAILVTLNPAYGTNELRRALKHVAASTLVFVPSLRTSDYLAMINELLPSLHSAGGSGSEIAEESLPDLKRLILVDNLTSRPRGWESTSLLSSQGKSFADALDRLNNRALDYRDLLDGNSAGLSDEAEQVTNEDVVNLQLTSGTTGTPKAVALTSRNLLNNGIAIGDTMRFTEKDILCNVPPLFHCFGLVLGNLAAWTHGASVVYAAEGFDPIRTLRAASQERCTALHGVPTHFITELEALQDVQDHVRDPEAYPLPKGVNEGESFTFPNLRTGLTSGSTVPIELMKQIMDPHKFGAKAQTVVYGQTETSPVTFGCDIDAPIEKRCETVGKVYPHVHAKIVDPEDPAGKPLPIGVPGEICTAGYILMKGYWNDEARTEEAVARHPDEPDIRWMKTGDIGVMDEEGYVRVIGRSKDIIIRGGENLFPIKIENCLDQLEGVASNAVIAVPDEKYGEAVGVFVLRSHHSKPVEAAAIRSFVREHLGGQSAPQWVWFLGENGLADDFPKTASGKVQKVRAASVPTSAFALLWR